MRTNRLVVSTLLCTAACATEPAPPYSAALPDDVEDHEIPSGDQAATSLGVAVVARNSTGAPRLVRAIAARPNTAGRTASAAASDHLAALAPLWVPNGPAMTVDEAGTQRLRNGATLVKLVQRTHGVVVEHGELRVLLNGDGSLAAVSGTLLPASAPPRFVSSAQIAVDRALDRLYGATRARPALGDGGEHGGWQLVSVAPDPELEISSARARKELANIGGKLGGKLIEAWSVELVGDAPRTNDRDPSLPAPVARRYLFADADGRVLRDVDLEYHDAFLYRTYAETTGNRRPFDDALADLSPHPTGVPDGTVAPPIAGNLVAIEAFNAPIDPWLAPNATTTSGNNVETFADRDGNRRFTTGDVRAEVRSGRVLNYGHDHTLGAAATPDQAKAPLVNAFFLANWLHDFWYDSGFTEATGNAQLDNYGRGGIGNDPLQIFTQFNAATGQRNGGSMLVLADGGSPQMMMGVFGTLLTTTLATPFGTIVSEAFTQGPRAFELTEQVVVASDGVPPLNDACQPLTNNVAGKLVLVVFSNACGSTAVVDTVKAAGAAGIILSDGVNENPRAFGGSAAANLPGVAIGASSGQSLSTTIANGTTIATIRSVLPSRERDGAFDNTVLAHEWGHYMHHRLTSCTTQKCSAMSEGWGDFNALMMMLRETDDRDGVYAIGRYISLDTASDPAYFGARRVPFSRDRAKNALSFRHIAEGQRLPDVPTNHSPARNSEVHNAGEIWTSMLWEAFTLLADEHGVAIARRRMADYVVAGLLLTPPEADFTEGRDALLAAASALDSDDMLLMAAAFAGRGAGTCAVSSSLPSNIGIIESGTLAAVLQATSTSLTDDGVSCDRDGYLDPGESGQLRVTLSNTGPVAAEVVTITPATGSVGFRLGAPATLPVLPAFSTVTLAVPVTMLATAARNTEIAIRVRVAGEGVCADAGVAVELKAHVGADDLAGASRIDHVDARTTVWTRTGDTLDGAWSRITDADHNALWHGDNAGVPSDIQLVSPILAVSPSEPFSLRFAHAFDLETEFDGGVIEISSDGGASWIDVLDLGIDPGYTGQLNFGINAIAGQRAFTSTSDDYPALRPATIDFGTRFAGQNVQIRFRIGTDETVNAAGWDIDDIEVRGTTNTPFSIRIAEPSTCTARQRGEAGTQLIASEAAPVHSLDAFDVAACIMNDTP